MHDSAAFAHVERILAPTSKSSDIIVMDQPATPASARHPHGWYDLGHRFHRQDQRMPIQIKSRYGLIYTRDSFRI